MAMWVALAGVSSTAAQAAPARRYVIASIARLRAAPDQDARIIATLRIGTPVDVVGRAGGLLEVRSVYGRGYLSRRLLSRQPPRLDVLLARAQAAKSKRARRRWLERATAFSPGDVDVIDKLGQAVRAQGDGRAAHVVEKGKIAAERRALSWDGPLYPIADDVVLLGRPCFTRFPGSAAPPSKDRARTARTTLRARAFELVASGKVVSISERGYRTQKLDAPFCAASGCGEKVAAYRLPYKAARGALVPSWQVAGFRVVPYKAAPGGRRFTGAHKVQHVTLDGQSARFSRRTLDGQQSASVTTLPLAGAVPIAHASEREGAVMVLFYADDVARACCARASAAFWVRVDYDARGGPTEVGRVYFSSHREDCHDPIYGGLPGEPRCARLPEGCELGDALLDSDDAEATP